jgi:(E)-4-hydroxy-3-methylbut-2-enyl-diphosphate synthase
LGRALRIGVNHGSLAERILAAHGNTPRGMVVSAREYLDIAEADGFRNLVVSMKASDPRIMVRAYRLLVAELDAAGRPYPLHLGVTEAGAGAAGRLRGATGIGALLEDGIGDTIRVSLTEAPESEVPVGRHLAAIATDAIAAPRHRPAERLDPLACTRRRTWETDCGIGVGGGHPPQVLVASGDGGDLRLEPASSAGDRPTLAIDGCDPPPARGVLLLDLPASDPVAYLRERLPRLPPGCLPGIHRDGGLGTVRAHRLLAAVLDELAGDGPASPCCLTSGEETDPLTLAARLGTLLIEGIGDAVLLSGLPDPAGTAFAILQGAKARLTRADVIACPGCGRTGYDLEGATAAVTAAVADLPGITIAVMGCIVNGPGEMADADYGLVGTGRGLVDLYRAGRPIRQGLTPTAAIPALLAAIAADGLTGRTAPGRNDR